MTKSFDLLSRRLRLALSGAALALLASACATIISGRTQDLSISSEPAGATVTAHPGSHRVTTPGILTVPRVVSGYRLRFEKPGFAPVDVRIKPASNGWLWGNIVVGGVVGLAIDYMTGAAYTISPAEVSARLTPAEGVPTSDVLYLFDGDGRLALTVRAAQ